MCNGAWLKAGIAASAFAVQSCSSFDAANDDAVCLPASETVAMLNFRTGAAPSGTFFVNFKSPAELKEMVPSPAVATTFRHELVPTTREVTAQLSNAITAHLGAESDGIAVEGLLNGFWIRKVSGRKLRALLGCDPRVKYINAEPAL